MRRRTCAKCGSTDVCVTFHAKGSDVRYYDDAKGLEAYVLDAVDSWHSATWRADFLACHCRTCQFVWAEDTIDATRPTRRPKRASALNNKKGR